MFVRNVAERRYIMRIGKAGVVCSREDKDMRKVICNMTREEAERLGLRPGCKIEHYYINNANGKQEYKRTGKVEKLYKFFFVAKINGEKGSKQTECFLYYLLKNQDRSERLYIKE